MLAHPIGGNSEHAIADVGRLVGLSDPARMRQEVNFFAIVVMLLNTAAIRWIWNSLAKDSTGLPPLSFGAAARWVVVGDFRFVPVRMMISRVARMDEAGLLGSSMLAVEVAAGFKPWGDPTNLRGPVQGINAAPGGFGSPSATGASFVFLGGSVRFVRNTADPRVLRTMASPGATADR